MQICNLTTYPKEPAMTQTSLMIRGDKLLLALDILGLSVDCLHACQENGLLPQLAAEYIGQHHPALRLEAPEVFNYFRNIYRYLTMVRNATQAAYDLRAILSDISPPSPQGVKSDFWTEVVNDCLCFFLAFEEGQLTADDFRDG